MTSPCSSFDRQMQLLLDGRVTPAGRAALDRHLAVCPACAARLEEYRTIHRLAAGWARPDTADDPGSGFNAAVLQRLAASPAPEPPGWPRLAAAALLIAASAALWRYAGPLPASLLPLDLPTHLAPPVWIGQLRAFGEFDSLLVRPASFLGIPALAMIACAAAAVNAFFIWRAARVHRRQVAPR